MNTRKILKTTFVIILVTILTNACFTPEHMKTKSIEPVENFDLNRYTGTWYEIARLPHRFEKNLPRVTATYTLMENGKIEVINRGFDTNSQKWKDIKGKAWIPAPDVPSLLKVSFFWFFAADYKVIALDQENHQYAMVTSSSKNYFWILARTPQLDETIYQNLIKKAQNWDFDISKIQRVEHK